MPLPSWPVASYRSDLNTFQPIQRMLDPLSTDVEGGERLRPGDNVGTITQTIWMSMAEHDTVVNWVKTTLNNGTARFLTPISPSTGSP
jgi:hypothetical protein